MATGTPSSQPSRQAPEQPPGGSDSSQMLTSEQAVAGRQPDRRRLPGQGHGLHPAAQATAGFPTAGSLIRTEFRQMLEPTTKGSSFPGLCGNTRFCNNKGCFMRPSQTIYNIQRGRSAKSKRPGIPAPASDPEPSSPRQPAPGARAEPAEASVGLSPSAPYTV